MDSKSKMCKNFATYLTKRNLELPTINNYITCVRQFLDFSEDILGWKVTEHLEKHHFCGYYLSLFLTTNEKPSTVNYKLSVLGTWRKSLSLKLPDYSAFRGPIPTIEELQKLYRLPQEHYLGLRNKLILMLTLFYGLTSTELERTRVKNIDFCNNQLLLNSNCDLEVRSLPLIPPVLECIQRYRTAINPTKFLLVNKKGQPLSGGGLRHILKVMLAQAGLPNYSPGDFRRAWLKHICSCTSISTALYLSGLSQELIPDDYYSVLENWHNVLSHGHSFLGVMDSRRCPSSSTQSSGDSKGADSACKHGDNKKKFP